MNKILILFMLTLSINAKPQYRASFVKKIRQTDRVEVHYLKLKKAKVYKTAHPTHLIFFKDLITKAKNSSSSYCDTAVEIRYFSKNIQIFKAYYSSRATGGRLGCAIAFTASDQKVNSMCTYGAGMLIDEMYYQYAK